MKNCTFKPSIKRRSVRPESRKDSVSGNNGIYKDKN